MCECAICGLKITKFDDDNPMFVICTYCNQKQEREENE